MTNTTATIILCCLLALIPTLSFSFTVQYHVAPLTFSVLHMSGGWGLRKKELIPEESARGDGVSGERRGFDAYELQEKSDFMSRVRAEQKTFMKRKDDDFLEIARRAGVTDQAGDGIQPMGTFEDEDENDDDINNENNYDIDVSVRWDKEDDEIKRKTRNLPDEVIYDADASITRMDGDLDVRGATGKW